MAIGRAGAGRTRAQDRHCNAVPTDKRRNAGALRAFRDGLRKRGWATGVNVQFDERWTGDNMDLIRSAVANLVELHSDAILAVGGRVIPVVAELTQSIPIVIPGGSDPVGMGYAKARSSRPQCNWLRNDGAFRYQQDVTDA